MINEEYDQLVRNNDRGTYLKGQDRDKKDTKANNRSIPEGPILKDDK